MILESLVRLNHFFCKTVMTKTSLVVFMAAIMVVGVLGTSIIPNAEALKGKGVGVSQYGSSTDVCGLVLCSEYPGGKEAYQEMWVLPFLGKNTVSSVSQQDESETKHISVSAHNADEEFPAQLDIFIHKFELDKISAEEALDGINEIYRAYKNAGINSDKILGVDEKIRLYETGKLTVEEAVEAIHLSAEPQNVNPEYQAALDEVIHKFELDKISAEEALEGIKEVHDGFVALYITSDLIEAVGEKIALIDSGKLSGGEAVEAIHLSAEPQNVDPEFASALDEVIHKFELDKISAEEAMDGITEVYDGMTELTITSDLIEDIGVQLVVYDSGRVSPEFIAEEINEITEKAELAAAKASMSEDVIPVMKELPPNTIDIPAGTAVPGCEVDDWCYMTSNLIISTGTTITWINSDTLPHTVTSGSDGMNTVGLDTPNGFDSGFMSGSDEYDHTFDVAGFYDYYCQLHPWMQGSVTVE